jgi:outer membrane protein TolC
MRARRYGTHLRPRRRSLRAAVLLLFGASLRADDTAAPLLTLDEALSIALANNRLVQSAVLDVTRADEKTGQAKSYRWPSLSINVLASYIATPIDLTIPAGTFGVYPGVGPIPAAESKVPGSSGFQTFGFGQLMLPVSQQYAIGLNVDLAKLAADNARESLRGQRQTTAADVRNAYYRILDAQAAREAALETLGFAREVERVVGDRFRAQKALEVDSLEARARLADAENADVKTRNALAQNKEKLNDLLGRDLAVGFRVSSIPPAAPYPLDLVAARARAVDAQPAIREARLQVRQAELNVRIAKAQYIPDLGLAATYLNPYSVDFLPRNIFTIGAFLQWEILDGGRRHHDIAEKSAQLDQAKLAAVRTENATLLDVGDKYRKVEESRGSLDAATLNRSARRERLRVAQQRYGQEVILADELLRTQSDFADAERQYLQALAAFWTARADLDRAVGEDVP